MMAEMEEKAECKNETTAKGRWAATDSYSWFEVHGAPSDSASHHKSETASSEI